MVVNTIDPTTSQKGVLWAKDRGAAKALLKLISLTLFTVI